MPLSGEFHTCLISQITVLRDERQRRVLDDIDDLADSINRLGLIHPIVLTRDYLLVAGERRLEACRSLGWTSIPFQFQDELDSTERICIELEENVKRKNLTWQEHNDAIARYHEIRSTEPNWTEGATAKALGLTQPSISQHLIVKKERSSPLINNSDTFRTAVAKATAIRERRASDEFDEHIPPVDTYTSVLNTSFHDWAPTYTGPKFNLLHCDFPYGINSQDSGSNPSGYDDSPLTFLTLIKTLSIHLDNFCTPSAHILFWFSPTRTSETWENLKLLDGFQFDEVPLIWHKSDGRGIAPDPNRRPRRVYETAFFGWRGDRKILRLQNNLYSAPTERLQHAHEKSEEMLRYFFEMVVDSSTRLLDPTCGSGSALRAATTLGASVLGLEINADFAKDAERSLNNSRSRIRRDEDSPVAVEL